MLFSDKLYENIFLCHIISNCFKTVYDIMLSDEHIVCVQHDMILKVKCVHVFLFFFYMENSISSYTSLIAEITIGKTG